MYLQIYVFFTYLWCLNSKNPSNQFIELTFTAKVHIWFSKIHLEDFFCKNKFFFVNLQPKNEHLFEEKMNVFVLYLFDC